MFVGKVFLSTTPLELFKTEYTKLGPIIGGTMMTSLFVSSIALSVSSLASRRAFATASVIAVFMLLPAASLIIRALTVGSVRRFAPLANPISRDHGLLQLAV